MSSTTSNSDTTSNNNNSNGGNNIIADNILEYYEKEMKEIKRILDEAAKINAAADAAETVNIIANAALEELEQKVVELKAELEAEVQRSKQLDEHKQMLKKNIRRMNILRKNIDRIMERYADARKAVMKQWIRIMDEHNATIHNEHNVSDAIRSGDLSIDEDGDLVSSPHGDDVVESLWKEDSIVKLSALYLVKFKHKEIGDALTILFRKYMPEEDVMRWVEHEEFPQMEDAQLRSMLVSAIEMINSENARIESEGILQGVQAGLGDLNLE